MTSSTLHSMYRYLSGEERFRLILAASSRDDIAERDKLSGASKSLELKVPDYIPWAQAFTDLAMIIFMEILEIAGRHREALRDWVDVTKSLERAPVKGAGRAGKRRGLPEPDNRTEEEEFEIELLGKVFASGFIFKEKVAGWELFCERLDVPALSIWESLPGYERLERTMDTVDETKTDFPMAFSADSMLIFLRNNRPEGSPEPTEEGLLSAEAYADGLNIMFRDGVKRQGG